MLIGRAKKEQIVQHFHISSTKYTLRFDAQANVSSLGILRFHNTKFIVTKFTVEFVRTNLRVWGVAGRLIGDFFFY